MVEEVDGDIWKHSVGSYSHHFQLLVNDDSNENKNKEFFS